MKSFSLLSSLFSALCHLHNLVYTLGVEPTNNAAERAIRPAVLWRKNSFGTQSLYGSLFVARIFTVVLTLRSQNKNILDFLVDSCQAFRNGNPAPSLLPDISLAQPKATFPLAA